LSVLPSTSDVEGNLVPQPPTLSPCFLVFFFRRVFARDCCYRFDRMKVFAAPRRFFRLIALELVRCATFSKTSLLLSPYLLSLRVRTCQPSLTGAFSTRRRPVLAMAIPGYWCCTRCYPSTGPLCSAYHFRSSFS